MPARTAADGQAPQKRRPGRPRLLEPSAEYLAKREELVATAASVFHEKGYDAGTLDDVADALDMRRASLYYYVRSKEQLLHLVLERAIDLALKELDELMAIDDPDERLQTIIRHQAKMVVSDLSLFSVFFGQRPDLDLTFEESLRTREARYLATVKLAVQAAIDEGNLGDIDPTYAAHCLLGMTTWPYKWFVPGRDNPDTLADTCVSIMYGLRGDAGKTTKPTSRRKR